MEKSNYSNNPMVGQAVQDRSPELEQFARDLSQELMDAENTVSNIKHKVGAIKTFPEQKSDGQVGVDNPDSCAMDNLNRQLRYARTINANLIEILSHLNQII